MIHRLAMIFARRQYAGGEGGGSFLSYGGFNGKVVEKIRVHLGWCLRGIEVWLTGDVSPAVFGKTQESYQEFVFEKGELITELQLREHKRGRLDGFTFKTSLGRDFSISCSNESNNKRLIEGGSGIWVGVIGKCGLDLDKLAFIFLKPISHMTLKNVCYKNLDATSMRMESETLRQFTESNRSASPFNWEFKDKAVVDGSSCWSFNSALQYYADVKVEAEKPKMKENIWELGSLGSYSTKVETKQTVSWSKSGCLQPFESVCLQAIVKRATTSIPFTGVMEVILESGDKFSYSVNGTYEAMVYETEAAIVELV